MIPPQYPFGIRLTRSLALPSRRLPVFGRVARFGDWRLLPSLTKHLFFLLAAGVTAQATASNLQLARELAEEGDWAACRIECRRIVVESPSDRAATETLLAKANNRHPTHRSLWRRIGALPVQAMVGFYRSMVAPALGTRCILSPSCSAYSLQSAKERGWLGLPMTADRLIREPSVVQAKERPITTSDGRIHYADPVSDHTGGTP